ncbi:hypothetical protein MRX96_018223 [Rhipicephalus microplus]
MEVVKAFNSELTSLYEGKPPISKAKMTAITKSAIKGIKFYKHIVQSVEKFVQKCRPEYKVPGLYVVDSIVRQSRHQFGQDKDVFAPRFTKNIHNTFQHLFKCPVEDRPKIVRVLNLWQKNQVFPPHVIQPLLDMANPAAVPGGESAHSTEVVADTKANKNSMENWKSWSHGNSIPDSVHGSGQETKTYALTQENLNLAMAAEAENAAPPDPELIVKLQSLASQLLTNRPGSSSALEDKPPSQQPAAPAVKFNKKLLDFDYGDEEEEEEEDSFEETKATDFVEPPLEDSGGQSSEPNAIALSMAQNLLNNPELLKQLQQMQQTLQQQSSEALRAQEAASSSVKSPPPPTSTAPVHSSLPAEPSVKHDGSGSQRLASPSLPPLPPASQLQTPNSSHAAVQQTTQLANAPALVTPGYGGPPGAPVLAQGALYPPVASMGGIGFGGVVEPTGGFAPLAAGPAPALEAVTWTSAQQAGAYPLQDVTGTGEGTAVPGLHGGVVAALVLDHHHVLLVIAIVAQPRGDRSRERETRESAREKERERERERRRKGFPPVKKNCLSVCSATLWLGHVPKSVSETDLHDTFGEFGAIVRIDMIPPRGCAYVCMDRRQDAFRALQKLKNLKLQGSLIKMAWAPGKGVKGKELKDFWEVDLGDSLSDGLKEKYAEQERQRGMSDPLAPTMLDMVQQQQQAPPSAEAMMAVAFPPAVAAAGAPTAVAMVPPPVPQFSIPLPPVDQRSVKTNEAQIKSACMMPSQSLVMPQIQLPMGVPPPPNHMLMVPPNTSQTLLGPSALGLLPPPLSLPGAALGLPPSSSSYEPPCDLPSSSDAHSYHSKPSCF